MPVLRALAIAFALGAAGALAVPLAVPSLLVQLDLPGMVAGPADPSMHAGHAGHAAAPTAKAAAHGHAAKAGPGEDAAVHSGPHPPSSGAADAPHADHTATVAGDHHDAQVGMQRPRFPAATGTIPSSPEGLRELSRLTIDGDGGFDEADGAFRGSGTLSDPYVLRGVYIPTLTFLDTDACFEVAESWIDLQLTLDWNGQCVWIHHNHIRDLRVNQNNARTGYATGGLIESNEITIIGQLRHFDGEFRNNVVGPATQDDLFDEVLETVPYLFVTNTLLANIDGFNQGLIHHNEFYGSVDLDFHGHHHGTGFFAPHSHYHGDHDARMAKHVHDHTDRWTSVAFTDNLIVDPEGYGLRYEDRNHAGDDRVARSESTKQLDDPHVHHTDILLARNTIDGGQLWVDVFNADDKKHPSRNPGTLTIAGNKVTTREPAPEDWPCSSAFGDQYDLRTTMHVHTVKEATTVIRDNVLTYVPHKAETDLLGVAKKAVRDCALWGYEVDSAAIRLQGFRDATILVQGNTATGAKIGVDAAEFDEDTTWRVVDNRFSGYAVHTADSVANEPDRS
jgi:hypothetical protein